MPKVVGVRHETLPNVILRHMKSMNNATVNLCYMLYQWVFFTHASETETETEAKKKTKEKYFAHRWMCVCLINTVYFFV